MRQYLNGLAVGILIIAVLVVSYVLIRHIGKDVAGNHGHRVYALFHDALGISERNRVLSAGLSVGQVEERKLDPQTGKAKVCLILVPEFKLYENASISKKAISLLGEYYLEIDPGSPTAGHREIQEDGEIRTVMEPTELGGLLTDVKHMASGSGDLVVDADLMLKKNSGNIEHAIKHVEAMTGTLERGLTDAELKEIREGVSDFRIAMHNLFVISQEAQIVSRQAKDVAQETRNLTIEARSDLRALTGDARNAIDMVEKAFIASAKNLKISVSAIGL
jgi:ABC-type transporter Mla subunit MlaD